MTTEPEITVTVKASQAQKEKVKLRRRVKANKPDFQGQEVWRYKRIRDRWRRPRGVDSKMRMKAKGWPKTVNVGYGGPKAARFLHPSGYVEVLVRNLSQIEELDPETQAIRIAHTIGGRKRREIIIRAKEKGFHVLNPREIKMPRAVEAEKVPETEVAEEEKTEEVSEAETGAESETVTEEENPDNKSR
jgi:large subunit ribosomal protein L32e